ncbi:MAG: response regulator transcription factor [Candidatus Obscuribacterales bacterium]|nr:response regulator transcription factor [Candidatus Obscuribacterales bacterium]
MIKILLAEDDKLVAETIADALQLAKYDIELVETGLEAQERIMNSKYDMAILDIGLPEKDGLELLGAYRASGGSMPILILTGKNSIENRVEGLETGADDYICKPFAMDELLARVRSLLRRPQPLMAERVNINGLSIDLQRGTVSREGEREVSLLAKEIALLEFLLKNRGKYFSAIELLNKVWASESDSTEDAVRQCFVRLRKKIDKPGKQSLIKSNRNMGYMIEQ